MTAAPHGAYGLALTGVDAARELLAPADDGWPAIELGWRRGGAEPPAEQWVRSDGALLRLRTGGQVHVDWLRGRALFALPQRPSAAQLVHPYLAPVAGLAARWLGREALHAGAFALDGGAWGILGGKEAGKSSLLAALALEGHQVLTDDVLVVEEGGRALLGPRSIDVREDAARRLGVRASAADRPDRRRLIPAAPPAALPLRGFVVLRWAGERSLTRVSPARRPSELAARRVVGIEPEDPRPLLALSSLPMFELSRPRDWRAAGDASRRLLDVLSG